MLPLVVAILMMAPVPGSIGVNRITLRDPQQGPTPVIDKYLIPERVPNCADRYQMQRAAEERIKGFEPECMLPLRTDYEKSPRP